MVSNDPAKAETLFRQAIELRPESSEAHRGLALALWNKGKAPAALSELTVASRLAPGDAALHYELGKLAWQLSQSPVRGASPQPNATTSDYQNTAVQEMRRALEIEPAGSQSTEVRLNLAELYLDAHQTNQAQALAEQAVASAPSNSAAHVMLGRALFAAGEEDKAIAEYKSALQLQPADPEAHLALGQLLLFQRKPAAAEQEFHAAVKIAPQSATAYAMLGEVLTAEGRTTEARDALSRAVALDSNDWHSRYQLATLLVGSGENGKAVELLENVVRRQPDFLPAGEQLGMLALRRGDSKRALDQAEALISEDPHAAEGHRLMALVLWKQRDYEMSLAECAMALEAVPDSVQMLALQAIELWQLDRKKEARTAFVQAGKAQHQVGTAEVFCRLISCDAKDIGIVGDFLRKNRWVLEPNR